MTTLERLTLIVLLILIAAVPAGLSAAENEKAIAGRHRIEIGFGLLSDVETEDYVVPASTSTNVSVDGPAFSLGYAYWPSEQWSLGLKMVVLGVDASHHVSAGQVTNETSTVVPFLFSVGFQPRALAPSPGVRPFITAGIGSFHRCARGQTGLV